MTASSSAVFRLCRSVLSAFASSWLFYKMLSRLDLLVCLPGSPLYGPGWNRIRTASGLFPRPSTGTSSVSALQKGGPQRGLHSSVSERRPWYNCGAACCGRRAEAGSPPRPPSHQSPSLKKGSSTVPGIWEERLNQTIWCGFTYVNVQGVETDQVVVPAGNAWGSW